MPPRPLAPYGYARRRPEDTVLFQVLQDNLETFLERIADAGASLPGFVEQELRGFLRCGILSYGFARCHCATCNDDLLVPFSCRGRGFCPSCLGRRMVDTAAHLVDRVVPFVPVRQWVLSLPFALRYRLAYDAELSTAVLTIFIRAVTGHYRRAAKRGGLGDPRCGAVTVVQRAGDGARLNLHYHVAFLDGVYVREADRLRFHCLGTSDEDVASIVATVRRRVIRLLVRRGLIDAEGQAEGGDPLEDSEPLLAACYQASVQGRVATGQRAGGRVRRKGAVRGDDRGVKQKSPLCACVEGFDLHANVRVARHRRGDLERLFRYMLRPPLATERLRWVDDDHKQVEFELRRTWSDGTRSLIFTPLELIEKLVALIPAARSNQVRYHGVLAPGSTWRPFIVATLATKPTDDGGEPLEDEEPTIRPRRLGWAQLLMRVLAIDVLTCRRCGSKRRIIAFIQDPATARQILQQLGLPYQPPPISPARAPPQQSLAIP